MKMMFHIDDFKCTLCSNWFCPPFNLPYLLPCTHSICTSCLQKASSNDHIICPEDLEACPIQSININQTTKKALQRLMKQHKNYNQNTQLQCIKSLSIGFDEVLSQKQKNLRNLEGLIDQIFHSQIDRLKCLHEKIKIDINRPYKIVQDWKQIVATHLTNIRKSHQSNNLDYRSNCMLQLNHYIEQGRRIKMQLNQFFQLQFDLFADKLMRNPRICFQKDFAINMQTLQNKLQAKTVTSSNPGGNKTKTNKQNSNIANQTQCTNTKTILNTCLSRQTQNKQQRIPREMDYKHTQIQYPFISEPYEQIQNNTIIVQKQNKKTNVKQPLSSLDMNVLTNLKKIQSQKQNQAGQLSTRRGANNTINNNGSKNGTLQINNLDQYIERGVKNQKDQKPYNSKNSSYLTNKQNRNDYKSKGKNSAASPKLGVSPRVGVSPQRGTKNMDVFLNKNGRNNKFNSKNSQNSLQKKSEHNLSQFHLQTLQNENELTQKTKNKQPYQKNKQKQIVSPKTKVKQPLQVQKQSPYRLSSSQISEYERMNKLANMLENNSNQNSNHNSNYNSHRNTQYSNGHHTHHANANKQKSLHLNLNLQNKNRVVEQASLQTNSLLMSPNTIRQQYTQEGQQQRIQCFEQQLLGNNYNQQLLINDTDRVDNENGWEMGNVNFLKEWKIKNDNNQELPLQVRQNTYYYNCQKQKLSYMRKMQMHRVQQAYKLTIVKDNYIELINQSLHDVDINLFLAQFDWKHTNIQIVKLVKTALNDQQLNVLLNFIVNSNVKALVLSGNCLTDICLDAFLNFVTLNHVLKNVYLNKNYINIMKSKLKINLLKEKGLNIYV